MRYSLTGLILLVVLFLGIAIEYTEHKTVYETDLVAIMPFRFKVPKQPHDPVQQYPMSQIKLSDMANVGTSSVNPARVNSSGTNLS